MAMIVPNRGLSFAAKVLWPSLLVLVVFVAATVYYLEQNRTAESWVLWLMGAAAVSSAALLATLVTWQVTRPLRDLRDAASAIGHGDFTRRLPVPSADECGQLAAAFNRMAENLQRAQQQLDKTITDLQATRAHLTQAQKLTVIGEFIAGIAHDLNNPLTSVTGFAQLLKQADAEGRHTRHTDQILAASKRCSRIVSQLLAFSRRHRPERKLVNLHDVVQGALEIIGPQLRASSIELVVDSADGQPLIIADPYQLQEVFVNIANNARQAIEAHRPGGRVHVATALDPERITVSFTDNGPGIPPENLERIFEPFFTTKPEGKGTGLGLSLANGIIQEHGGSITVRSTLGAGTTFIIALPLAPARHTDLVQTLSLVLPNPGAQPPARPVITGKRVLAIDDDAAIREMLVEVLAAAGCEVDTAVDGQAALEKLASTQYDAAVCDICMPRLNGHELFETLREHQHPLRNRFVFITGDVTAADRIKREPGRICLTKPLSLDGLVNTLGQVMAGK